MALSEKAKSQLAGLWGSYDFWLIRDRHFATASDMVERFLEKYEAWWSRSDSEYVHHPKEVRRLLTEWAERKLANIATTNSMETIRTNIMFKQLHYGDGSINFGSVGTNWKKKTEIAKEIALYKPWSLAHAAAVHGGRSNLRLHLERILAVSNSPSEKKFFEGWWNLTDDTDRPMLFPQVWGHTSGKLWQKVSEDEAVPMHFDFGLVNVVKRTKTLIDCEPLHFHQGEARDQLERDRQNVAAKEGWLLHRFTYVDVMERLTSCFENLEDELYY